MNLTRNRAKREFGILIDQRYPDTEKLAETLSVPIESVQDIKAGKGMFDSELISRIVIYLNLEQLAHRYCKSIFARHKRHQGAQWVKGTVKSSHKVRLSFGARR